MVGEGVIIIRHKKKGHEYISLLIRETRFFRNVLTVGSFLYITQLSMRSGIFGGIVKFTKKAGFIIKKCG